MKTNILFRWILRALLALAVLGNFLPIQNQSVLASPVKSTIDSSESSLKTRSKAEVNTSNASFQCSDQAQLVDIANSHIEVELEAESIPTWAGAQAGEIFPYYNLEGKISAYMISVETNGQALGYIVVDASQCNVIEYSEGNPPQTSSLEQAKAIADQWKLSIDELQPVYLGPFDKFYVLRPGDSSLGRTLGYRVLLNMLDYSYTVIDSNGNKLDALPNGNILQQPKLDTNLMATIPEIVTTESAVTISALSKQLNVPSGSPYLQLYYIGTCYIGCTPNAGAAILGYWAQNGYPNVYWGLNGQGIPWGTIRLHDLAGTWCVDTGLGYSVGVTWFANLSPALTTVFHERGYPGSNSQYISSPSFDTFRAEIDQERPVVANFNGYNGGGWNGPDHSTSGIGYDTATGNYMIVNPNLNGSHSPVYVLYGSGYSFLGINTLVPPAQDSATWVGQSPYPTVSTGSTFQIYFDLQNNGATTWTPGNYWLQNTNNAPMGTAAQQPITSNVAPGQTYRFTMDMTAPATTGIYRTQWAVSHNGTIIGPPYEMYMDITVTTFCGAVTEIPQSECKALQDLYNSTNGPNWTNKTDWLQTITPCSWYGITCTAGHVSKVLMFKNNLVGSIPSTIDNLSNLTAISFSTNQLSGSIPSTIGNLSNLTTINFSLNQLTGNIPPEMGSLSQLTILGLGTNQLSGSIPTELGNLSNLTQLWLDTNLLTGNIPSSLGNLSNLNHLCLFDNQLSGSIPWQLGNLSQLQYLYLYENQLSSSIPNSLGSLTNLQKLALDNNQLTGSIPPELGNLTNLTELSLYGNQLIGSIPTQLSNLKNLTKLVLSGNQLSGSIPPWLGSLTKLTWLELSYNWELSGSIPTQLGNLTNLTYLNLGSTQISGSIPNQLGNLTNLWFLGLYDNQLTGSIPTQLGNLTNLTYLELFNTQLSGEFPASITKLVNLTNLSFDFDCGLTSSNPSVITFINRLVGGGWQTGCLKNGDFETYTGTSKIPTSWTASQFATLDGKNTTFKTGKYSVKIAGTPGKTKSLTQTLALSGPVGDTFTFSFYVKADRFPAAGLCQAQVLFYSGNTLKGTKPLNCPAGTTYAWKKATLNFTALAAYTKVVIKFTFSKASGTVWFDAVSLTR
jgi:Leucine-rich repeat (LRR) protein